MKKPIELSRQLLCEKYGRGLESVVFDQGDGNEIEYVLRKGSDAVCVLALTENQEVILARQFRYGPQKVLMELPGGGVEPGEDPAEAAARELLEETGYAGNIQFVTRIFSDAYSPTYRYCFVATSCTKNAQQKLDDTEDIDVVLMLLEKFRVHLRSGELSDVAVGYVGLDYLGLL